MLIVVDYGPNDLLVGARKLQATQGLYRMIEVTDVGGGYKREQIDISCMMKHGMLGKSWKV